MSKDMQGMQVAFQGSVVVKYIAGWEHVERGSPQYLAKDYTF